MIAVDASPASATTTAFGALGGKIHSSTYFLDHLLAGHRIDHSNRLAQITSNIYWIERGHDVQDRQPSVVPPSKCDSMSERMKRRRAEINRAENLFEFDHGDVPYFVSWLIATCYHHRHRTTIEGVFGNTT